MRLDEFVTFIREQTKEENPNIVFIGDNSSLETLNTEGNNLEVSHRSEWHGMNKICISDFYIVEVVE